MDEPVCRLRLNGFQNLPDLVDVDLVRELSPEDDSRFREAAPDGAGRLYARQSGHLNVKYAEVGAMLQREIDSNLSILGFDDGGVPGEFSFEQLAQVMALGDIIFSN
jgi:hypothetical protein